MKFAKSVSSALLATGLVLVGREASAQMIGGIPFAQVDINGDGFLDAAELMAAFDAAGLNVLSRDLSGDGMVTREELRTSRQYAKDEPPNASGADATANAPSGQGSVPRSNGAGSTVPQGGTAPSPGASDSNNGHGNDAEGSDSGNPGRGHDSSGNGRSNGNGGGQGNGNGGRS